MENKNTAGTEQCSNNCCSLVSKEYIEEDSRNAREENVHSDNNITNKTGTNFTDKGSSWVEIDLNNSSKMTESSIRCVFLGTALQDELDFEDQLHETKTAHCEHSRECQTLQEGNLICPAEEKPVKNSYVPQLVRDDGNSKIFPDIGMDTIHQTGQSEDCDMEEGEIKDVTPSPENSPRQSCKRIFLKNIHLSRGDKGNYCMFSPVSLPPAPQIKRNCFGKRFAPYFCGHCFQWRMQPLPLPSATTGEIRPDCPWERDLKYIKELIIKSKRMNERETNFGERRRTSERDGNCAMDRKNCKKNQNFKNNLYKNKIEMRCSRGRNDVTDSSEREHLQTYRFKQTKPVYTCKVHSLLKTGKRDEKQTATRLSVRNYEMSKRLGIQTAGARGEGQRGGLRIKCEKTAGKRFRSASRSSCSSYAESPKLSTQKKSSKNVEIGSTFRGEDTKTNPRLPNRNYSTNTKCGSLKLPLKLQSSSTFPLYSKNCRAGSISHDKGNIYQNSDHYAKEFGKKSYYGDFLSLAEKEAARNVEHKIKLKSSLPTSFSASGSRIISAQRMLAHCSKAVTSSRNLSSKCRSSAKASLTAAHGRSLTSHPPSKSLLSPELSFSHRSLSSASSSVSSITSSSSSGSNIVSQTKRRPSYRNEMEHLIHYSKERYKENIAARESKGKHSDRHSKQVAPITETLCHCTTKILKNSSKRKNNVMVEFPNTGHCMPKRNRKTKESSRLYRGASKMNSVRTSQHFSSSSCKPTAQCYIRKPRSRKEKLLLLLSAIEEAIARKRALPK